MRNRHLFVAALTATLLSTSALAATSTADFVKNASIANKFEIDSSKIALAKSDRSDVKSFATKMVNDHTKTGVKFKAALAASETDAKPATKLDDKHQEIIDSLKAASGDDFNDQYITAQTDAHKEAVSLFSDYADNGDDASLKSFAGKTLPDLKKHLAHVKTLTK